VSRWSISFISELQTGAATSSCFMFGRGYPRNKAKTEPNSVSLLLLNSGTGKANEDLGMNKTSSLQIPLSFKVFVW
jgi:hypothetical protein